METTSNAWLLAIDPGLDTGWALFTRGFALLACGVGQPPMGAPYVVIEKPQVYRGRGSKGDPNDLITLAVGVGRYLERAENSGARVALVLPRQWKGTIDKEIHHQRIRRDLPIDDLRVVVTEEAKLAKSKVHNMMDAVGLGLWAKTQKKLFAGG